MTKLRDKATTHSPASKMATGETKTIVSAETGRTWQLHRTERPYAYDLAQAYREAMTEDDYARGVRWIVTGKAGSEQVRIVYDEEIMRAERKQAYQITGAEIARMSDEMLRAGLECGALVRNASGRIVAA